jgi:hypothetical protein
MVTLVHFCVCALARDAAFSLSPLSLSHVREGERVPLVVQKFLRRRQVENQPYGLYLKCSLMTFQDISAEPLNFRRLAKARRRQKNLLVRDNILTRYFVAFAHFLLLVCALSLKL